MEFTVDRSKWLTKEVLGVQGGPISSELLHASSGLMCCLGHLGLACGIKPAALAGSYYPTNVPTKEDRALFPEGLLVEGPGSPMGSKVMYRIAALNDGADYEDTGFERGQMENMTQAQREAALTEEFAKLGITVKFEGDLQRAIDTATHFA